ncbi:carbon storage regulator [Helicobacter sp. CLO-3]|uniref:carbon storage regulator n=1 Tax=unclassified Helicobacter TaxID=2593540 RepID=UPI00080488D4|nr:MULTISPECIES: carbon storage regulator [unclassified Helicobacter]OBV29388.1 carbon storage regulator [Helicobacter sp. CLO-3]OHU82346.1 carbon storage regulator [Helicobacter sp. CLO-3]
MLILSRKQDESIIIGDNIAIKVISIDRGSVKLGFDAPPSTLILRAELKEAIVSENKKALQETSENELKDLGRHFKR